MFFFVVKVNKRSERQGNCIHVQSRERDNEMRERDRKGRLLSARSKTALKSRFTYKSQCASSRLKADYTGRQREGEGEGEGEKERKRQTVSGGKQTHIVN